MFSLRSLVLVEENKEKPVEASRKTGEEEIEERSINMVIITIQKILIRPYDFEQWSFELRGKKFHFVTNGGVFSVTRWTLLARGCWSMRLSGELPEGSLLDVGCGYGPVGLALAYASQLACEMIDINQRAVDLAKAMPA